MAMRLMLDAQPWREGLRKPVNWVVGALALVCALLIGSQLYVARELNDVITSQENYRQYDTVLKDLELNLTSAESGQRGYLITQDNTYLAPYNQALPTIRHDLAVLHASPLSRPYRSQLASLTVLTNDKLGELNDTISVAQQQGQAAAYAIVNQGTGQTEMQSIRQLVGQIHDAQSRLLQAMQRSRARSVSDLLLLTILAVICILALITQVLFLRRSASRKEALLDSMRQQFITIASHQLRTPATAIKQYLYLLLAGDYGHISKTQRTVLEQVDAANERGIGIVNSLLDVTRLEAAGVSIQARPVDVRQLLTELAAEYEPTLTAKGQSLKTSLHGDPVPVMADPFYFRMAIENILDNASKYSGDGKVIHLDLKSEHHRAVITVRDEGIGIEEHDLPRLFTKFTRLPNAHAATPQGSGLGLYIAKLITTLHGGTIGVESSPRSGTTFTIRLPQPTSSGEVI